MIMTSYGSARSGGRVANRASGFLLPVLKFVRQPEWHGITEFDNEGSVVLPRHQDPLAPFMECPRRGHGFVELTLHASAVGCRHDDWEVNSGVHGSTFSSFDCRPSSGMVS